MSTVIEPRQEFASGKKTHMLINNDMVPEKEGLQSAFYVLQSAF